MRARAREEFISVLKRLVSLLPRMNDGDKDRVFKFVNLAEQGERTLKQVYEAEALLSKYDPQFALEKKGERIEARLTEIDNAKKLRKGLAELHLPSEFRLSRKTNVLDTDRKRREFPSINGGTYENWTISSLN